MIKIIKHFFSAIVDNDNSKLFLLKYYYTSLKYNAINF
ncbi:hypothetical protein ECH_0770 [Ehrlichia chaffeensis str. Arkansas]|uniref:Uncharacterized protein n=1 Tax=Ehrlichia chaffeensis (strain ATCC CRL-10679 / Arkansas) TaxID=205920 RepID=Q2GG65_EHRCR|nr:hypothetical protein ECH_0770 [Ehrlichia chaffeensis str. Arkansas]